MIRNSLMMTYAIGAYVMATASLGWMVAPLVVPHLTVGHVVFAASTFTYIIVATHFEEADLIKDLGDSYRDYRERVPKFIPFLNGKRKRQASLVK